MATFSKLQLMLRSTLYITLMNIGIIDILKPEKYGHFEKAMQYQFG